MADLVKIKLLGKEHAIRVPQPPMGIAIIEDLNAAWWPAIDVGGMRMMRASAAFIGLCTRLGAEAKADYARYQCDPIVYGGHVYGWLTQQGASQKDIVDAAVEISKVVLEHLHPRESEVSAVENFTSPRGAPVT